MQPLTGKPNVPEAIRLLGEWTRGRYDIWNLAGFHNAGNRAILLSQLTGKREPQSKAGVNALRDAFYSAVGGVEGSCIAAREDAFLAKVKPIAPEDKPLAGPGLSSYRYRGTFGWVMIGAKTHEDALREAKRSTDAPIEMERLQIWDGHNYTQIVA